MPLKLAAESVVVVAVGAPRMRDGLRRLVDRVVVERRQHGVSLLTSPPCDPPPW